MEKVDEKWLKKNGWACWEDEVKIVEETPHSKVIEHHTIYTKSVGNINNMKTYKRARWDHTFRRSYIIGKSGKEYLRGTSNFYVFGAFGDGFETNNRISHRKFESDKIEAALKLCGINE